MRVTFGTAAEKGKRSKMEDAHHVEKSILKNRDLAILCDGHRGSRVAQDCCVYLPRRAKLLADEGEKPQVALSKAFVDADTVIGLATEGTCLVVAWIDHVSALATIAWAGDCEAIAVTARLARSLTPPHQVGNASERRRLRQGGFFTTNELGQLNPAAITRAIGDRSARDSGSIPDAETRNYRVPRGRSWLALLCDGITNVLPPEAVAIVLRSAANPRIAANFLVRAALKAGSSDNVTAVVAQFDDDKPKKARAKPAKKTQPRKKRR